MHRAMVKRRAAGSGAADAPAAAGGDDGGGGGGDFVAPAPRTGDSGADEAPQWQTYFDERRVVTFDNGDEFIVFMTTASTTPRGGAEPTERKYFDSAEYQISGEVRKPHPRLFAADGPATTATSATTATTATATATSAPPPAAATASTPQAATTAAAAVTTTTPKFPVRSNNPLLLLHGGGHSAMSWALVAKHLKASGYAVIAPDLRGHGQTRCGDEADLSAERMVADVAAVAERVMPAGGKVVVVGHSMGGAIAARLAASAAFAGRVAGLVVMDVVEGTAMESLPAMRALVEGRPRGFADAADAVAWAVGHNMVRNPESARISLPSQLVPNDGAGGGDSDAAGAGPALRWRTDLLASEPHWHGWFAGLSPLFLSVRAPKLLLLAGTDRLDRPLTVAQMQGKFQLKVLPAVGHVVQEDAPELTATALIEFKTRNGI